MRMELSTTTFEQKLEKIYNWAFFKRLSEGYEKPFAESYAEGYTEGYATGLEETIISLEGAIEPETLAERFEISVEDVLHIWEQS